MDRGSSGGRGVHSIKDIAADVTEGFCELMDKTRSQMEELDPLEAHVNQREIFKKNLQGLKEKRNVSEDSDSGVGVSSSSSGSWTLDNYKQKLQSMEEEKVDRVKMIEEYLQNQQHEIDKGLFPQANADSDALSGLELELAQTGADISCHNINIENDQPEDSEPVSSNGVIGKKHVDYKTLLQEDILEDIQDSLLIPEINFEAPTPKIPSPCLSPGRNTDCLPPKRDFVLKYRDEEEKVSQGNSVNSEFKITDQDWDRMEEIAEKERLEEEALVSPEEVNENRKKLEEFRRNPQVNDVSKTRLAEELKQILAEAQRRLECENFPESWLGENKPKKKKNRKHVKEVTFQESKRSFDPVSVDSSSPNLKDVLMKVERNMVEEREHDGEDIDENNLLNGFMDGFEEEEEKEESIKTKLENFPVERGFVFKAGVTCLVALGAAVLLHKIRK